MLKIAAEAQAAYWTALRDLEQVIGFEIDDPGDLRDATLGDLIGRREASRTPKPRRAAAAGSKLRVKTAKRTR